MQITSVRTTTLERSQMESPLWLTRPTDIQAHLIFAAAEIPSAILTVAGVQVHGRLSPPDTEGHVAFVVDGNLQGLVKTPKSGDTVRVEYEGPDDAYSFFTSMSSTDLLKRWLLATPGTIERTHQRLVSRTKVAGDSSFSLTLDGSDTAPYTPLQDISNNGLSFTVGTRDLKAKTNQILNGTVTVPSITPMSLSMEIRHVRPKAGDKSRNVVGVRFSNISLAERTALSKAISAWKLNSK